MDRKEILPRYRLHRVNMQQKKETQTEKTLKMFWELSKCNMQMIGG